MKVRAQEAPRCVKCDQPFPPNTMLRECPNGREFALDRTAKRVWRICTRCGNWNYLGGGASTPIAEEMLTHFSPATDNRVWVEKFGGIAVWIFNGSDVTAGSNSAAARAFKQMLTGRMWTTIGDVLILGFLLFAPWLGRGGHFSVEDLAMVSQQLVIFASASWLASRVAGVLRKDPEVSLRPVSVVAAATVAMATAYIPGGQYLLGPLGALVFWTSALALLTAVSSWIPLPFRNRNGVTRWVSSNQAMRLELVLSEGSVSARDSLTGRVHDNSASLERLVALLGDHSGPIDSKSLQSAWSLTKRNPTLAHLVTRLDSSQTGHVKLGDLRGDQRIALGLLAAQALDPEQSGLDRDEMASALNVADIDDEIDAELTGEGLRPPLGTKENSSAFPPMGPPE